MGVPDGSVSKVCDSFDLRVVNSNPMVDIELLKKNLKENNLCTYFVRFTSKHFSFSLFSFFGAKVSDFVFLISNSNCSLLIYRKEMTFLLTLL